MLKNKLIYLHTSTLTYLDEVNINLKRPLPEVVGVVRSFDIGRDRRMRVSENKGPLVLSYPDHELHKTKVPTHTLERKEAVATNTAIYFYQGR